MASNWFGGSSNTRDISFRGNNNDNLSINVGVRPTEVSTDTAVQSVVKSAGRAASKIIEGGGDVLTAPATWVKDIQANWLTYMIVAAIIISCIMFFYCTFCFYFNKRKNNCPTDNLVEILNAVNKKKDNLQQPPLPLTVPSLSSVNSSV